MATALKNIFSSENRILTIGSIMIFLSVAIFACTGWFYVLGLPIVAGVAIWLILDLKSFYFFFLATITFSPQIYIGSFSTSFPDEQMMWLFLGVIPLFVLVTKYSLPRFIWRSALVWIIIFQFLWLCVAVLYSQNIPLSAKFLVVKSWQLNAFVIVPLILIRSEIDIKKALISFAVPTVILAVIIFIRHYQAHFGFYESNLVAMPFFVNHVDHSTILSMTLPMLFAGFLWTNKLKYKILFAAVIAFFIIAIYFTFARAAMLALIFSSIMAVAIRIKKANLLYPFIYSFAIGLLIFLVTDHNYLQFRPDFSRTYTRKNFKDLMLATVKGHDMSSMERFHRWIACIRMSTDRPLVGVGPNNFYYFYKPYTVNAFQTYTSRNEEHSTTHNYFLYMLVEQGWPAMIFYGCLMLVFTFIAQKYYHKSKVKSHKVLIMMSAMIIAASFVNNFFSELLETHKVGCLFYLSIVLLIILVQLVKKESDNEIIDSSQTQTI